MGNKQNRIVLSLLLSLIFTAQSFALNPRQYVEDGLQLYQEERFYKAIDSFRRAIDSNPYYADAYRYLAQVYFDMGEYDLSLENAMSALKYSHKDIGAMLIIGNSYRELGKYSEAETFLLQVKKQFPSSSLVYRDLGELYILMNRKEEAKRMLDKAVRLDGDDWRNYTSMAHYYLFLGQSSEAEKYFQKSFSLHSRERVSYIILATFYYDSGKIDQAIALLEKGETLFENFISGVTLLGDSYLRKKDYQSALEKYKWLEQKLPSIDKKSMSRLYFKIALASEMSDSGQAVRYYQKALQLSSENQLYRYSMEDFIIKNFSIKDPLRKEIAQFHYDTARKAYNQGSREMYFYHLKRAVYLYPFLSAARQELVSYFEGRGDYSSAYDELKGLFKVDSSSTVKNKLENYDWRISRGQLEIPELEVYEFQAFFVTEDLPQKIDDVISHMVVYHSRNFKKFKLYPFSYRKNEGLNLIIQDVREKKYNFFIIADFLENGSTIQFQVYDRLGKKLDQISMYYNEMKLEETVNRLYRWIDGQFPTIAKVNGKISAKRFTVSYGKYQELKTDDTVSVIQMEGDVLPIADFRVTKSAVNIAEIEMISNKSFNINDFSTYGVIKNDSVNKKHLTKLKRILVY